MKAEVVGGANLAICAPEHDGLPQEPCPMVLPSGTSSERATTCQSFLSTGSMPASFSSTVCDVMSFSSG